MKKKDKEEIKTLSDNVDYLLRDKKRRNRNIKTSKIILMILFFLIGCVVVITLLSDVGEQRKDLGCKSGYVVLDKFVDYENIHVIECREIQGTKILEDGTIKQYKDSYIKKVKLEESKYSLTVFVIGILLSITSFYSSRLIFKEVFNFRNH